VADTRGAAFHPDINFKDDVIVLNKAEKPDVEAYSAFQGTNLAERLRAANVDRLWMGGLALDYCVRASALDASNAGFDVHLVLPATRPITEETGARAVEELREAGVKIEENSPV
jgi:nicotinamidase/pyrazinamidase